MASPRTPSSAGTYPSIWGLGASSIFITHYNGRALASLKSADDSPRMNFPQKILFGTAVLAASACAVRSTGGPSSLSQPDTRELVIVSTTDVHGRLRGWDYYADTAEGARGLT